MLVSISSSKFVHFVQQNTNYTMTEYLLAEANSKNFISTFFTGISIFVHSHFFSQKCTIFFIKTEYKSDAYLHNHASSLSIKHTKRTKIKQDNYANYDTFNPTSKHSFRVLHRFLVRPCTIDFCFTDLFVENRGNKSKVY